METDRLDDINYIYVLDYSTYSICEIKISDDERDMEIEDIIEKHGCNTNTSSWMCGEYPINTIDNI